MDITFAKVRRIMLMSDDALGPPRRSLYVKIDGQAPRIIEGRAKIEDFLETIGREQPALAKRIALEFATREMEANCEALLYDRDSAHQA